MPINYWRLMDRIVLHFCVYEYSTMPAETMAAKIGDALGCTFEKGRLFKTDAFIAHLLGLNVHLYDVIGLGNREVFVLASMLEEHEFLNGPGGERFDLTVQEISVAISDLLNVRLGGGWHPPTEEETRAVRGG
jgi:hypothetical protein